MHVDARRTHVEAKTGLLDWLQNQQEQKRTRDVAEISFNKQRRVRFASKKTSRGQHFQEDESYGRHCIGSGLRPTATASGARGKVQNGEFKPDLRSLKNGPQDQRIDKDAEVDTKQQKMSDTQDVGDGIKSRNLTTLPLRKHVNE